MSAIATARHIYRTAVQTAESLWEAAKAGDHLDPRAACTLADDLASLVSHDRTALVALTALKNDEDDLTFTHMVNVAALTMVQVCDLGVEGPLLRDFGIAGLLHDIGKVNTPPEILNKPDALTTAEFAIVKRHVIDGESIIRRSPGIPRLAATVAFEHHLRQDLSGYPEHTERRQVNVCTSVVAIADVFDALRGNRPYRQGLATSRIRTIMSEATNPAFHGALLHHFVCLMGLFPVGTLVRLDTGALAVVTAEYPDNPSLPQVKVITDPIGRPLDTPVLANTWEPQDDGGRALSVVEAVEAEPLGIDTLRHLDDE